MHSIHFLLSSKPQLFAREQQKQGHHAFNDMNHFAAEISNSILKGELKILLQNGNLVFSWTKNGLKMDLPKIKEEWIEHKIGIEMEFKIDLFWTWNGRNKIEPIS